jgi:tetratricopeptide (TPR) repeat protein
LQIANCYIKLNRFTEAVPWFERYLQDNPDVKNRHEIEEKKQRLELLGSVAQGDKLMEAKRYDDAKKYYENAVSIRGDDAHFHFKLAEACVQSNDLNRAISEYQCAHSLDPTASGALKNIGICYVNMGRIRDGIDWFQRYVDENPDAKDAAEAKKVIDHLNEKVVSNTADSNSGDYYETCLVEGKPCKWLQKNFPLKVYIRLPAAFRNCCGPIGSGYHRRLDR